MAWPYEKKTAWIFLRDFNQQFSYYNKKYIKISDYNKKYIKIPHYNKKYIIKYFIDQIGGGGDKKNKIKVSIQF